MFPQSLRAYTSVGCIVVNVAFHGLTRTYVSGLSTLLASNPAYVGFVANHITGYDGLVILCLVATVRNHVSVSKQTCPDSGN